MSLSENTKEIQAFIKENSHPGTLTQREAIEFYHNLIDCIIDHNHLYYIDAKPIISDREYDELFEYLKKIEQHFPQIITSNSPTQGLVGQISEWFVQAKHENKLLSLENTYNAKDLEERNERIEKLIKKQDSEAKISYRVEPKFDGLSVELIYKKWIFHQAITRWDGMIGDDITENVKTIKNIPKKLKLALDIHVRGEILMPKSVRRDINKEREDNGETPFANTRNAAAGSIKLLDPKEVAKRGLICYVYDILNNRVLPKGTTLADLFPVFPREKTGLHIAEIIALCENPETKKTLESKDVEFDGLVIKVESTDQREYIWSTDHHPRWAVAYKFPAQLAATQIRSVDFQVGRTGVITPVANLEPVQLSGARLKRVSLHNFDFIKEKDIHLDDWIWLQRSGEVIPYIVSVITDRRTGQETKIHPPKHCPSCHQDIINKDIHYYCINPHCPEKIKQQLQHYVSKNCMDIQGIGESMIDILVENKIVTSISDIYKLPETKTKIHLLKFPGLWDKKITEIVKGVEDSKHKSLRRLLNGLGIPGIGKKTAQDIQKALIEAISQEDIQLHDITKKLTDREFLENIYGVGEKIIEGIISFFHEKKVLLEKLEQIWLNFNPKKYTDTSTISENNKGTFSITGTFPISRESIIEQMQNNGYTFHESPTKTTDIMLVWEKPWSKKAKAEELWIKIYEWRDHTIKEFSFLKNAVPTQKKSAQISLF